MLLDSVQGVTAQMPLMKADLDKLGRSVNVYDDLDKNGDGFLTTDEVRRRNLFFDKLDKNQDGLVSLNEVISTFLTDTQDSVSRVTYQDSEKIADEFTARFRIGHEGSLNSQQEDMLTLLNQTELTQNIRHAWLENLVNDKDLTVLA